LYIVNPEVIDPKKLYRCTTFIKDWLIYTKHLPPFGQNKKREWYFARTDKFKEAIKDLPIYLRFFELKQ